METFRRTIVNNLRYILFVLVCCFIWTEQSAIIAQEQAPYTIQVGDTWAALALRTDQSQNDLLASYGSINRQQQPAVGRMLDFPEGNDFMQRGRLTRPLRGGLLELAARNNQSPWQLATTQDLVHPFYPVLLQPVIQTGSFPLRELPVGFDWLELAPNPPGPGEAIAIRGQTDSGSMINVQLNQSAWHTGRNGRAFVTLGATGAFFDDKQAELFIFSQDEPAWSQPIQFTAGDWTYEEITYSGSAAAISDADIREERQRLRTIWSQVTPTPYWENSFRIPLDDFVEISSLYGARRAYNDGPYDRYHEGVDFSAFGGTPVYAPAGGVVAVAEILKVRGGTVILDHGLGVYTGTYHLSELFTTPGQQVQKGDLIGAVGTTGLSTGNHLHWDFLIGTGWVNGRSWLENDLGCWLLAGLKTPCPSEEMSPVPPLK